MISGARAAAQGFLPIPSWKTELRQLAPNVYAYTQASGPGVNNASLSNAGVIEGPDGLLAIDTLGPPIHARAFKAAAEAATRKRFGRVINTHHHRDHTNGNCFFAPVEIVSQPVHARGDDPGRDPGAPLRDPSAVAGRDGRVEAGADRPRRSRAGATYRYGTLVVEVIPNEPAHTSGDVMVYLPEQRILFAGDVAFYYVTPAGHNAQITRWIDAIDRIDRMDVDLIVPGHGPIGSKKELAETRAYLELRRQRAAQALRHGDVTRSSRGRHERRPVRSSGPTRSATPGTWCRVYAELDGTLTPEHRLRPRRTRPSPNTRRYGRAGRELQFRVQSAEFRKLQFRTDGLETEDRRPDTAITRPTPSARVPHDLVFGDVVHGRGASDAGGEHEVQPAVHHLLVAAHGLQHASSRELAPRQRSQLGDQIREGLTVALRPARRGPRRDRRRPACRSAIASPWRKRR